MPERKTITLYLAGWQKRMAKDYLKKLMPLRDISKVKISVIDKRQLVMYRQPILDGVNRAAWNLYLTDEQINHVVEMTGLKTRISALNISPEMIKSKAIIFE